MVEGTFMRVQSRLLQQIAAQSTGTDWGSLLGKATDYVSTTFTEASLGTKAIIVISASLCACLIIFVVLFWVSEWKFWSRKLVEEATEMKTPTASPLSVDLESPTKSFAKIDEHILRNLDTHPGVERVIQESMEKNHDVGLQVPEGRRKTQRNLNLKLKAAPNLRSTTVSRKRSNTMTNVLIANTQPKTSVSTKPSVGRKHTYGANDHVNVVKPLLATDLTVPDSVKSRDISKTGWVHNPHARRTYSAGTPCESMHSEIVPVGVETDTPKSSSLFSHGSIFSKQPLPYPGNSNSSSDFKLLAGVQSLTNNDKLLIHQSINSSTGGSLASAQSIGPYDLNAMRAEENSEHQDGPVARKDTKLGNIVILDSDQILNEVVLIKLLGAGGSGSVHEAIWRGSLVAVKLLHPSRQVSPSAVDTFVKEVRFMSGVRSHPGVVKVCGACFTPPNMSIITELAESGSLHQAIHDRAVRPEYRTLIQISEDIAEAMSFCHSQNLIHRDLKTQNVLLDSNGRAKICDFGLAVAKEGTLLSGELTALGTASYMAPEQFSAGQVDEKCDVYAFGCILWEMVTGRQPWEECNNVMQIVMAVGVERRRPPLPRGIPGPIAAIIRECWRHNPALRPSFKELAHRLRNIHKEEEHALAFRAAADSLTKRSPSPVKDKVSPRRHEPTETWNKAWSPVKTTLAARAART